MPISLTCPQCAKRHQAPDALAGRQARCGCGAVLAIPARWLAAAGVASSSGAASGSWQPQPGPAAPAAGTLFDEISPADRERLHRQSQAEAFVPATSLPSTPLPTAAGGISASEYMAKARDEICSRQQREADALPQSVTFVVGGLSVPGVLSLAMAFGALLVLASDVGEELGFGTEIVAFVMVAHGLIAALNIAAVVLIYLRIPFSRPLGYCAAVSDLCGGPVHFICAVMVLFFLSTGETAEYVRRRGAPGAIDW